MRVAQPLGITFHQSTHAYTHTQAYLHPNITVGVGANVYSTYTQKRGTL